MLCILTSQLRRIDLPQQKQSFGKVIKWSSFLVTNKAGGGLQKHIVLDCSHCVFVGAISVQWCRVKKVISGTIVNCRPPALLLTNNLSSALSHLFRGKYSEEFHVKLTFKRWNENIVRIQLLFGSFLGAATFWGKLTLGTLGNVSANMQSPYSLKQSSQ